MTAHPIVLFDGICNYCNSMVNFAIRNDREGRLRFAPLQSDAGRNLRKQYQVPTGVDSVVFIENDRAYYYSDAALRITRYLQGPARLLYGFMIIPRFIREPIYKWIARNRYKWFGKKDSCMIPTPEVRDRFLD